MNKSGFFTVLLMTLPLAGCNVKKEKPNVLFICVDDLRRELGCYGSVVKTPNIDRLASEGSLFFNHYVQVPTSGASRASMLTGYLPSRASDTNNDACVRRVAEAPESDGPETMFHHLRMNGYYTVGIGKIGHYPDGRIYEYGDSVSDRMELPHSWDEMLFDYGQHKTAWDAFFGYADGSNRLGMKGNVKPYECADVGDDAYADGLTADLAVKKIRELAGKKEPFCLAVGFLKPHLPFVSPKKYWDLYDEESIPLSPMKDIPEGCHIETLHSSGEFNSYRLGEEKPSLKKSVSDDYARKLRHAYFACVSYVDAQIGKVLDALEESGEARNTIVVLWGDHGWHLGDLRVWGKHTLHETALSSSLIVKAPGFRKGVKNYRIVSSVDIYPTLSELCGLEPPAGLDGHSFVSLLDNPDDREWQEVSYGYFNDGFTMRTPEYRISRYEKKGKTITELYEYDGDRLEKENIAEKEPDVVRQLMPLLEKGITFKY